MLFEETKTKLVLDTEEWTTLKDAYVVLIRLINEMSSKDFSEVVTDDSSIGDDILKDTADVLYMLAYSNILEVE